MRAGWRFGIAALAAALICGSAPGAAQDSPPPETNTARPAPAGEIVGPRELRDFTINGTVTRPAPPPERTPEAATPPPRATTPAQTTTSAAPRQPPAAAPARPAPGAGGAANRPAPSADPLAPFTIDGPAPPDAQPAVQPGFEPAPLAPASTAAQPEQNNFIPWLLALLLLAGAGAFFFWRQRSHQPSYASASTAAVPLAQPAPRPQPLQRAPPPRPAPPRPAPEPAAKPAAAPVAEPATRPDPRPVPTPAPAAAPLGLVTTSLRPWLDIEFTPGRCVVEDDKATIQFDVTLFNSGSAPARDVLIEASMFNAGPAQDQEIGAFFARPQATGERIPAIPPLRRVALKSAVSLTREQLRQFDVGGRKLFVPLVGVNALYRWSSGEGQTSASYVVGRDTQNEKMAPLRLDLGPRIFRGLGARAHDVAVRN